MILSLLNFPTVRKIKVLGLVLILLVAVTFLILFFVGYFKPKGAGILIDSTPASTVYINDEQVGRTPYSETLPPSEITIRMVPESFENPLVPFSTKVSLASGIQTVIRREFQNTEEKSSGETLSFEKIGGNEVSLSVVSVPDSAQLSIDSVTKAFTPYKTSSLSAGEHRLEISAMNYNEKEIKIRTYKGYKLTAYIQLAKLDNPPEKPKENQEQIDNKEIDETKTMVEISKTPTGFLRVRSEPSTLGEEIAQIKPGEQYELLNEDEETGWFNIKLLSDEDGEEKTGWISDQYAEIIGDQKDSEISATPTSGIPL